MCYGELLMCTITRDLYTYHRLHGVLCPAPVQGMVKAVWLKVLHITMQECGAQQDLVGPADTKV